MIFVAVICGIALGWLAANADLKRMGVVSAPLTLQVKPFIAVCRRLITQASAARERATRLAFSVARSLLSRLGEVMDRAQQIIMERLYERRMAVRAMFLSDPRNPNSPFTERGRKVLAYWAKQAHAFAPVQTVDPIQLAKAEGRRELFALILSDIFDDLPNLARMMAAEEARLAEEIVHA